MKPTKAILNHPQYHINDYNYFKQKGYTNKDILAFWDRDLKEGNPDDWKDIDKVC